MILRARTQPTPGTVYPTDQGVNRPWLLLRQRDAVLEGDFVVHEVAVKDDADGFNHGQGSAVVPLGEHQRPTQDRVCAVSDIERAKRFYEAVFALTLTNMPTPEGGEYWTFPMSDTLMGAGGALTTMEGMQPGPGGTLIYFACDDCAVEQARVEPAGGKVLQPKMAIGEYGFIAICMDTEGNPIGLYSQG